MKEKKAVKITPTKPLEVKVDALDKFTDALARGGKALNKNFDKALDFAGKHSKPLYGAGAILGAGYLHNKLRQAQRDSAEKNKLKSEKAYYDAMIENLNKGNVKTAGIKDLFGKIPSGAKDVAKYRLIGSAMAGGTTLATKGILEGAHALKNRISNEEEKNWKKFIDKYPEYEAKDNARDYFSLMMETSPHLAKHPIAVKTYLNSSLDLTPGNDNVRFDTLKDVSKLEQDAGRRTNAIDNKIVDNMSALGRQALNSMDRYTQTLDEQNRALEQRPKILAQERANLMSKTVLGPDGKKYSFANEHLADQVIKGHTGLFKDLNTPNQIYALNDEIRGYHLNDTIVGTVARNIVEGKDGVDKRPDLIKAFQDKTGYFNQGEYQRLMQQAQK